MQEGISLQQVLSYLFLTVPISLAGVIFTNSSIFREGKKIKIASELNIFEGSLTRAHWHECALTIFCHETCKIKTLPLAMLKLNSPFLLLNYLIPQSFILGLTFFPALMSITHSALVCSSKCSGNLCMTLRPGVFTQQLKEHYNNTQGSSTMLCQELYKDHQLLFFEGSKWVLSITPTVRPRAQLLGILLQHFAGWDTLHLPQGLFQGLSISLVLCPYHSHGSELLKKTEYHFLLKSNPLPSWLHWENCPQKTQALNLNTLSGAVCGREFPG